MRPLDKAVVEQEQVVVPQQVVVERMLVVEPSDRTGQDTRAEVEQTDYKMVVDFETFSCVRVLYVR